MLQIKNDFKSKFIVGMLNQKLFLNQQKRNEKTVLFEEGEVLHLTNFLFKQRTSCLDLSGVCVPRKIFEIFLEF